LDKGHTGCKTDDGHRARAIKVYVRKKAPNSWKKYCENNGITVPTSIGDFEKNLKREMGEELWGSSFHKKTTTGGKTCYDHLWFKCCSNYPHKNLLCPEVPTLTKKKK
jgi:hypothetical protein